MEYFVGIDHGDEKASELSGGNAAQRPCEENEFDQENIVLHAGSQPDR